MNDGEDNNGILLFPSSTTKIALFEPTLQAVESFKSLKFKSKLQKLDKTMMRKLAITGEQILFEAQHFLRPTVHFDNIFFKINYIFIAC